MLWACLLRAGRIHTLRMASPNLCWLQPHGASEDDPGSVARGTSQSDVNGAATQMPVTAGTLRVRAKAMPAETLALQSNRIVLLDHGTDIFVWYGKHIAEDAASQALRRASSEHARDIALSRRPASRVTTLNEGDPNARGIIARLLPTHRDPPAVQEATSPVLNELDAGGRAELRAKFMRTSERSFAEYVLALARSIA